MTGGRLTADMIHSMIIGLIGDLEGDRLRLPGAAHETKIWSLAANQGPVKRPTRSDPAGGG